MKHRGKKYEKPEIKNHGNLLEITKGPGGPIDDTDGGEGHTS